ncbi:MAG: AAA family ATPase [Syntrophomonas sp.]
MARLVAELFCAKGILPGCGFIETKKADLVDRYVGGSARNTAQIIQKLLDQGGGVLFIDEAYGLGSGSGKTGSGGDFNADVIETLIKGMEDFRDRICVIFAGYAKNGAYDSSGKNMESFLESNPGLKRRISYTIEFPDYTPEEQMQILRSYINRIGYYISEDHLRDISEQINRHIIPDNAGGIRTLLEHAEDNQAVRIHKGANHRDLLARDFDFNGYPEQLEN